MGCCCCAIAKFCSQFLDSAQRISICIVTALLVTCVLLTIAFVGAVGVGIGYHYCVVQNSVEYMVQMQRPLNKTLLLREGKDPDPGPGRRHLTRREAEFILANNNTLNVNNSTDQFLHANFTMSNVTKSNITTI